MTTTVSVDYATLHSLVPTYIQTTQIANDIWKVLTSNQQSQNSNTAYSVTVPTPNGKFKDNEFKYDICISYSLQKGKHLASIIASQLSERRIKVTLAQELDSAIFDADQTETRIIESRCNIILLTADSMNDTELLFAFEVNRTYKRKVSEVFLVRYEWGYYSQYKVHAAETCYFPNPLPSIAEFFSEKAITVLQCYIEKAIDEILARLEREKKAAERLLAQNAQSTEFIFQNLTDNAGSKTITVDQFKKSIKVIEKSLTEDEVERFAKELDQNNDGVVDIQEFSKFLFTNQELGAIMRANAMKELNKEDLKTRLFLSHKRTTGQGIAGRLYEGLKSDYKVFLDSEAKFVLHNLQMIVESTEVLIFILSAGIHTSMWCLQELKSAVKHNKKVVVVKDLSYVPPDIVSEEWKGYEKYLKPGPDDALVWMAEFNDSCLDALRKKIGPPDSAVTEAEEWIQNNPTELNQLLKMGILNIQSVSENVINAILWLNPGSKQIISLRAKNSQLSLQDIEKLTKAQAIEIDCCKFDDTNFWQKRGFGNLQKLTIKNCTKLTDTGLAAIISTAPNLEKLDLSGSKEITNAAVETLAQFSKNLKTLTLSGCKEIDSNALIHIAKLGSLTSLDLSMCHKLNDSNMESLLSLQNLQFLNLTGTFITDKTLCLLCDHPFQKIDFTCTAITDDGLSSLKATKWASITTEGCAKITDACLKKFAERTRAVIHVMSHDSWPKHPQTAKELKQIYPHLPDGEYKLYHKGDPNKPYQVYCYGMQTSDSPMEYISLQSAESNFSQYVKGGSAKGDTVTTWFSRIRYDPLTDKVKTNDWTFARSEGRIVQIYWNRLANLEFTCVAYATARDCLRVGKANAAANINLIGTPFKVVSQFKPMGCRAAGTAEFSSNDQVVAITGGGFPGRNCPEEDVTVADADGRSDGNNEGRNGGWVLRLEWIGYQNHE